MKNSLGEVIYIGKAKILKNRLKQYFQNPKNHSEKVKAMVKHISEFEYIVTDSEMEALLLESNLIKKHIPRYNIVLKDDKFYPFIKITTKEEFPRVLVTRNFIKDGNKYFGPYTNASMVHEIIELIKKIFPLRTCKKVIGEGVNIRPCLNFHIKQCKAPCAGFISKEEYRQIILEVIDILNGKDIDLIKDLKKKMGEASEALEFEKAAKLRDKILSIKSITEKQKVFKAQEDDEDFINFYSNKNNICVQVFFMRKGKIIGREHFILEDKAKDESGEILEQFIISFYGGTAQIPKYIYVPNIDNQELLEEFLSIKRSSKVWIKKPQKGNKKNLLDMVKNNAEITFNDFKDKILKDKEVNKICINELKDLLDLEELPTRIEAYDISNIQGIDSVGGMIVFEEGRPKISDYRKFRIKSVIGPNDYDSMREILERRFSRGLKEIKEIQNRKLDFSKGKFSAFPDLIMMDGGKGQVNVASKILRELNIEIPICGMVKDDNHKTRGLIYNDKEIILNKNSNLMHMITRIQDEVHRFAITYHRTIRNKKTLQSILDDIPNIGEKRKKALLLKFKIIDDIKKASLEDLLETPTITKKSAESIIKYFSNK